MNRHATPVHELLRQLDTDPKRGLSAAEARSRLERYGANELRSAGRKSVFGLFLSQFNDLLIYVLLAAAALSVAVGLLPGSRPEYGDAILILAIVVANGALGFVQDFRAEKALEALRTLAAPVTRVVRDGGRVRVPAAELVPGEIILIEQGDRIPADAVLLESHSLETTEAALTGESTGVSKRAGEVAAEAPLAERTNMVFTGTDAVRGRARAVVVATGMNTEVGSIAAEVIAAEERPTPFQREVDDLGKRIGWGVLALIVVVGVVEYLFTSAGILTTVMVAITLAVAAVPEGLPAVVTLTLAIGSRRLARQRALARRLSVVESLGGVDVIATDKTGTLTENRMTVTRLLFRGEVYELIAGARRPFRRGGALVDPAELAPLLRCGALANDAEPPGGDSGLRGDPTEIALIDAAASAGVKVAARRVREIPFSSDRKRMTVIAGEPPVVYAKGAPEVILDRCDRVWTQAGPRPLEQDGRRAILAHTAAFGRDALRVLACASKPADDPDAGEDELENGLVFLGLAAMRDPPRPGVREAIADCRRAGIRVIMVTGDNLSTAVAIGAALGFRTERAVTGAALDALSDAETERAAADTEVFARVAPHHKVRLLHVLQRAGHRVAMTGDGVNDAPALRHADVGVAMGLRGTEVAKQASDMVLADDNFVTLRNAVEEGRGIFDNIRKFVAFLLSANAGEIAVVVAGVLVGSALFPQAFAGQTNAVMLTPAMLLWINVVTDGLPALALAADPRQAGIMERPPRRSGESIIDRSVIAVIVAVSVAMAVTGLGLFFGWLARGGVIAGSQTLLFTFVVVAEMAALQLIRGRYRLSPLSNRWLVAAVASSLALQGLLLMSPLADTFRLHRVGTGGWLWCAVALAAFCVLAAAAWGVLERRRRGGARRQPE